MKMDLKKLSDLLADKTLGKSQEKLKELATLFEHLPTEVAIRHQRDYDACIHRSKQVLEELFDHIDLSDKRLMCVFLKAVESYGYFKIAQIAFSLESQFEDTDSLVVKAKWYELTPLLPSAGYLGWKGTLNHCFVKEERHLFQVGLRLLSQKLHFLSVIATIDRFQNQVPLIKKNGKKVVEKLFELIRDVAHDDGAMFGMDTFLFNLILPYADDDQIVVLIDAIVQDLFKPFILQKPAKKEELDKLHELIHGPIMNRASLQDSLTSKFLEHMKCNVIRRKRRHSVEASLGNSNITLESILDSINAGAQLVDLIPNLNEVELSFKSLQTGYIAYWIQVLNRTIPSRGLTARTSLVILNICFALLVTASPIMKHDLICDISSLIAKTVDNTGQDKLDKLFKSCDPILLVELTRILCAKTDLLTDYESPLKKLYTTYLNRYLRSCLMRVAKPEADKFEVFVNFVCDKEEGLGKDALHLLQHICVKELSDCFDDVKRKGNSNVMEVCLSCFRKCSKKMYKFIKRNFVIKTDDTDTEDPSQSQSSDSGSILTETKSAIVIETLVCIIKAAIEKQDQETLDTYGELLRKLYNLTQKRVEQLVQIARTGSKGASELIDLHICRLISIYFDHTNTINGYLNYDFIESISSILIPLNRIIENGSSNPNLGSTKKVVYTYLKTKLDALEERAKNFADVHQSIINKQFNHVVEEHLCSTSEIKKEKSHCTRSYFDQMKTLSEISSVVTRKCDFVIYEKVLNGTIQELEQCDPLNHPNFLYLILIFESLIVRSDPHAAKDTSSFLAFKEILPKVSCSLIRIAKTVELGPSIHAFTKAGSHKSNKAIQCCTYSTCIKVYTQIFIYFPPDITDQFLTDAMQICISSNLMQYSKYSIKLPRFFVQLASSIAGLIRSICIGRKDEDVLKSSMPIFLAVFSSLIRCLIIASDRQKLEIATKHNSMNGSQTKNVEEINENDPVDGLNIEANDKQYETQLEHLALDISKTLNNLSLLRVKLVDYAPHLICAYIKDMQRASSPDFVRIHLNEGIFRIFNLIDAHQKERQEEIIEDGVQRKTMAGHASGSLFEMIHARLDQASREIFRDMHENYNKFHRYLGKC